MVTTCQSDQPGPRVLVVEDAFLIADEIAEELLARGCRVVGPVPGVSQGVALAREEPLDGALLDVNLAGERCFPIADALAARNIPFAFLTGYGETLLPPGYRAIPRLSKPFAPNELASLVERCFKKST